MWAMSSADTGATLYYWQNSRSGEVLDHMLRHGMQKSGSVYEFIQRFHNSSIISAMVCRKAEAFMREPF